MIPPTFQRMITANADAGLTALMTEEGSISYAELLLRAASFTTWLDEIGIPRGRPLPALLGTTADALALVLAGAGSQRPVAPLGVRLTESEIFACVAGIEARSLVAEGPFEMLGKGVAERGAIQLACLSDAPRSAAGELDLESDGASIMGYLHTSGTTGLPKPVPMRNDRLAARARANATLVGFTTRSVYATASPIHHVAGLGMMLVALSSGAAVLPFPSFSISAWCDLAGTGVTHALLVPTMIERLLREGCLAIDSLEMLQYGAAPMDVGVLRAAMAALPGVRFVQIYGQTEGSPITCLSHEDHLRGVRGEDHLLGTVGRAAPGVELRIEDPGENGIGEVCARAPHLFAPDADGWLRTGDLGRKDEEGFLTLRGRRGDMIVRAGENVYPLEVERVLEGHPAVREVAVVGVPDRELGERVRAYLAFDPDAPTPDDGELRTFCRQTLSGFKVPEQWVVVEALPRNPAGKVLRRRLLALGAEDRIESGGAR